MNDTEAAYSFPVDLILRRWCHPTPLVLRFVVDWAEADNTYYQFISLSVVSLVTLM